MRLALENIDYSKKSGAQSYPIKAAHQPVAIPDLDRMGKTQLMQRDIQAFDVVVDPSVFATRRGAAHSAITVENPYRLLR